MLRNSRALRTRDLCTFTGHMGRAKLIIQLDNKNYGDCPLTSQDVRNAEALFGPCIACTAKDKARRILISLSIPAYNIGERLHADLYPLKVKSIGGNTFILLAVDEKSGHMWGVPIIRKTADNIWMAFGLILGGN